MKQSALWIGLAVVVVVTLYMLFGKGDPMERAQLTMMYATVVVIVLYAVVVLVAIATGEISIGALLSEAGGGASMSRFQLLIFTLTIAMSFVFIVVSTKQLPKVPTEILTLLGVSASTYAVSKGIQAGGELKPKTDGSTDKN